jgi:formate dehydrogenase iron-sulfur subunit
MSRSTLIDTTRCIGCRGCQVACKQAKDRPAEHTEFFAADGGYQNPAVLSSKTLSLVGFHEVDTDAGEFKWVFTKHQCMHCLEPSCASACIVGALHRNEDGAVVYDTSKCIGCRYCMIACPFGIPTLEWDKTVAYIQKCDFCSDRQADAATPTELNGAPLSPESTARFTSSQQMPACAKGCPTGAIQFGERDALLAEAKARLQAHPDRYVDHIYGEKEAGGTAMMYLSAVPFERLGFPSRVGTQPYPSFTEPAMKAVPGVVLGVGGLLAGSFWLTNRREAVQAEEGKE